MTKYPLLTRAIETLCADVGAEPQPGYLDRLEQIADLKSHETTLSLMTEEERETFVCGARHEIDELAVEYGGYSLDEFLDRLLDDHWNTLLGIV